MPFEYTKDIRCCRWVIDFFSRFTDHSRGAWEEQHGNSATTIVSLSIRCPIYFKPPIVMHILRYPGIVLYNTDCLTSTLTKLLCPILEFLQTLLADTRSDIYQAGLEILKLDRANLVHRHLKQRFTKRSQGTHCCVFGESCDIRSRKP